MQDRTVLGDVDVLAGEHRVPALRDTGRLRPGDQGGEHFIVDGLLRVVDAEVGGVDDVAIGTVRIVVEEFAQRAVDGGFGTGSIGTRPTLPADRGSLAARPRRPGTPRSTPTAEQ